MANCPHTAKSGSDWTDAELHAYNIIVDIPSLPLTTTFPLWKTALRLAVTLPSPLVRGSELVGASMVRSGVWGSYFAVENGA
jgi:hypothetical protein